MRGIYKITNEDTGKVYIGESMNIDRRWKEHKEDLNNNTHTNKKLQNDWNLKFNDDLFRFEVLEEIDDRMSSFIAIFYLVILEDKYIKEYNSVEEGYNLEYTLSKVLLGEKTLTNKKNEIKIVENIINRITKGIALFKEDAVKYNEIEKPKRNKIICIETNEIYKSAKEATKQCSVNSTSAVTRACRKGGGRVKLKDGKLLTFRYCDETEEPIKEKRQKIKKNIENKKLPKPPKPPKPPKIATLKYNNPNEYLQNHPESLIEINNIRARDNNYLMYELREENYNINLVNSVKFHKVMRDNNIYYYNENKMNVVNNEYIDNGYFILKETTYCNGELINTYYQNYITDIGKQFLIDFFLDNNYIYKESNLNECSK